MTVRTDIQIVETVDVHITLSDADASRLGAEKQQDITVAADLNDGQILAAASEHLGVEALDTDYVVQRGEHGASIHKMPIYGQACPG